MSVVASDIVIYGAANIQETDSGTMGGAIATTVRYIFDDATLANDPTASAGDGTLKAVSSSASDITQVITVTGRNAGGSIVTDTFTLNGTTVVAGGSGTVFERILKAVITSGSAHVGSLTISDSTGGAGIGNTILVLGPTVTTIRRPFYNVSADVSGGSSRDFYEKVFVKNNNGTNALLNATFIETADPTTNVTFALEDAVNDSNTSTNRVTAPTVGDLGAAGFDSASKTLASQTDAGTTDLAAGAAIGIWLKLTLAAGAAAAKSTYTLGVSGSTT